MNDFNVLLTVFGATLVLIGLGSKWLEGSPLPPTLLALVLGIVIGPVGFNLFDPTAIPASTVLREQLARLTLAIGLMGVALRIPRAYLKEHWRAMLALIGGGMLLMWAISTAIFYVLLDMPLGLAALIGGIVTPTDPVAASPIVTGAVAKANLPQRLRLAISFESGANDGLAYLFVFLAFLLLERPAGAALSEWFVHTLLWEVVVATGCGMLLGYVFGKLLRRAERAGVIQANWRLIYTAALALFAAGLGRVLNSDEVLVVFVAGVMFTQVISADDRENEEQGQEAINRFFAIPIFIFIGAALPWAGWGELGWSGIAAAVAVLLLRRPLTLLLLRPLLSPVHSLRETLFLGWFGPVAVSALYYAALFEERMGDPLVWHVTSLVICASVLAHGVSGAPLTKLLGRHDRDEQT